jgi:hypothetical protein
MSTVAYYPSKVVVGVRIPLFAFGLVAQSVEWLTCNQQVKGSNPFETLKHKMGDNKKSRELLRQYMRDVNDPPWIERDKIPSQPGRIDLALRNAIGRTEDLDIPKCHHAGILQGELVEDKYPRCRQCGMQLPNGAGRYNDFLIFRHPKCPSPICLDCSKERPDTFYLAFKEAVKQIDGTISFFKE